MPLSHLSRSQYRRTYTDTLTLIRETIRQAIIDSLAYPGPPHAGQTYYRQKLYQYRRVLTEREAARDWFRALSSEPGGFSLMWEGLLICDGPALSAEGVVQQLEQVWKRCDQDPQLAAKVKDQLKAAATIYEAESWDNDQA